MYVRLMLLLFTYLCLLTGSALAQEDVTGTQVIFAIDRPADETDSEDLQAVAQVLAGRLANLDVADYRVQIIDGTTLQVQFSGDSETILDALMRTALLELVDFSDLHDQIPDFEDATLITSAYQDNPDLPRREDGVMNPLTDEPFTTVLTNDAIASAEVQRDDSGRWVIAFELTESATAGFKTFTANHLGQPLAIVLDGRVLSAPVVQAAIEGEGVIVGDFSEDEARTLSAQLSAGALPLPLLIESLSTYQTITPEK